MKSSYLGKVYLKKGTPDSLTKFRNTKKKKKKEGLWQTLQKREEKIFRKPLSKISDYKSLSKIIQPFCSQK